MPHISAQNDFVGAAKRLDHINLPNVAHMVGLEQDVLRAFVEIEAQGSGFDGENRPTILFEPHVFHRNLPKGELRSQAERRGVAHPRWGAIPYGKLSAQYPRLKQAMMIHPEAALKACSWGLPQILGENHVQAGYPSVQDMVLDFMEDEENQLAAMATFIKANRRLFDAIKAKDWKTVARIYNGPGFAKNRYDVRLAAAYGKWRRVADIPPTVAIARMERDPAMRADLVVAGLSMPEAKAYGIRNLAA